MWAQTGIIVGCCLFIFIIISISLSFRVVWCCRLLALAAEQYYSIHYYYYYAEMMMGNKGVNGGDGSSSSKNMNWITNFRAGIAWGAVDSSGSNSMRQREEIEDTFVTHLCFSIFIIVCALMLREKWEFPRFLSSSSNHSFLKAHKICVVVKARGKERHQYDWGERKILCMLYYCETPRRAMWKCFLNFLSNVSIRFA